MPTPDHHHPRARPRHPSAPPAPPTAPGPRWEPLLRRPLRILCAAHSFKESLCRRVHLIVSFGGAVVILERAASCSTCSCLRSSRLHFLYLITLELFVSGSSSRLLRHGAHCIHAGTHAPPPPPPPPPWCPLAEGPSACPLFVREVRPRASVHDAKPEGAAHRPTRASAQREHGIRGHRPLDARDMRVAPPEHCRGEQPRGARPEPRRERRRRARKKEEEKNLSLPLLEPPAAEERS